MDDWANWPPAQSDRDGLIQYATMHRTMHETHGNTRPDLGKVWSSEIRVTALGPE
jgi:hypothetical protein